MQPRRALLIYKQIFLHQHLIAKSQQHSLDS